MKVIFILGTRPEAIKLAPLIKQSKKCFDVKVCVTAQHREMLDQALDLFDIKPDYDLNLMNKDQTLSDLTSNGLTGLSEVLHDYKPDVLFVQGDTTTTFTGALAGFYHRIKVAHVEAGLRSNNKHAPFPEEINRILTSRLADYHFAPTEKATQNLINEGIKENIWNVGNTVVDALFLGLELIEGQPEERFYEYFKFLDFSKRIILVTGHRRESFGKPFNSICNALEEIAQVCEDIEIVFPVHLNPNVRKHVNEILSGKSNIHLIEPLGYAHLIWLMSKSYLVLTDSGGIQEEAPSLGKPVLVMRDVTERIEGVEAKTAKLVGTSKKKIVSETFKLLNDRNEYKKIAKAINPYGDGKASQRIIEIMNNIEKEELNFPVYKKLQGWI